MLKLFLMSLGVVAFMAMNFCPQPDTFAGTRARAPKIKSGKERCRVCGCGAVTCRCKSNNKFKPGDTVSISGKRFSPLDNVNIYVTSDRVWNVGDPIGADMSADGVDTVAADIKGKILCTGIWAGPIPVGQYDIVVDANLDGIYNEGDAIDGKVKAGFKVK